jgi:hypothetical protein
VRRFFTSRPESPVRKQVFFSIVVVLMVLVVTSIGVVELWPESTLDSKTVCIDPGPSVDVLNNFSTLVKRPINCAVLFSDSNRFWSQWARPWFIESTNYGRYDWRMWLKANPAVRRVVITQEMVPADVPSNWRELGSVGTYDHYARQLAVNLVAAGMGNAIIRLGHEMNGTWYHDSLGNDPAQYRDWANYWARIVKVMRAVSGANFLFDWCVSSGYRNIPFDKFYPGNSIVDIVGIDVYDSGMPGNPQNTRVRWAGLFAENDGLAQVLKFAHEHKKPISVPEWGLVAKGSHGLGDDPTYAEGVVSIVKDNAVAYQSYFDSPNDSIVPLQNATQSLRVWEEYFGSGGSLPGGPW